MKSGASFDPSGEYRYRLWRIWDADALRVTFIMLNPSTADGRHDDPTIRRCLGFARRWGYGSLDVVNLFALRATYPHELIRSKAPIGPRNDVFLRRAARRGDRLIVAWGGHGELLGRGREVAALLEDIAPLYCLGETQGGQPRHPLYLRKDSAPRLWTDARSRARPRHAPGPSVAGSRGIPDNGQ